MKKFLLSQKVNIALIALNVAAVLLSYFVPQRIAVSEVYLRKWREANPAVLPLVDALSLHHVFTTPAFAVLLVAFLCSLLVSLWSQFRVAKRLFSIAAPSGGGPAFTANCTLDAALAKVQELGYSCLVRRSTQVIAGKNRFGHWGNFLLHLGIVVAIAASVIVVLFQRQGSLNLAEGTTVPFCVGWDTEDRGLLAPPLEIKGTVLLDKLDVTLWENDDLKQIRSRITIADGTGRSAVVSAGISGAGSYQGTTIYQTHTAGHMFTLRFRDQSSKTFTKSLLFPLPVKKSVPAYNEFSLPEIPYHVKGKYYADEKRSRLLDGKPLLVLRTYGNGGTILGEVALRKGEVGKLGEYEVELLDYTLWTKLNFSHVPGISIIFLGFFIICLGGGIHYFFPPRSVWMEQRGGRLVVGWKAARFPEFFKDEYDELVQVLTAPTGDKEGQ